MVATINKRLTLRFLLLCGAVVVGLFLPSRSDIVAAAVARTRAASAHPIDIARRQSARHSSGTPCRVIAAHRLPLGDGHLRVSRVPDRPLLSNKPTTVIAGGVGCPNTALMQPSLGLANDRPAPPGALGCVERDYDPAAPRAPPSPFTA